MCFNGAALSRARKVRRDRRRPLPPPRFNGAALSRARKAARLLRLRVSSGFASTGPRSHERGRVRREHDAGTHLALQRGRALTSAEGGEIEVAAGIDVEASTGPRSHERGRLRASLPGLEADAAASARLQRGRALTSAEGSHLALNGVILPKLQRGRALTSAEGMTTPSSPRPTCTLQRGRALTSAEGAIRAARGTA